ncbi:MAG: flavodoxin domain-containing protein [Aeromicrobium sp.]
MKTLVVHASKYGSTERYAEWIGEALGASVMADDEVSPEQLAAHETVAFCSAIYGPTLRGSRLLRRGMELFTDTRWVLMTVGLSDPALTTKRDELVAAKFPPDLRDRLVVAHVRGAMDRHRLSLVERSMMSAIRRGLAAKRSRTAEEQAMLEALQPDRIDLTDRAAVAVVVDACLR